VASAVLGRTNQVFPANWFSLGMPANEQEAQRLVEAAIRSGAPLCVSKQPGFWGSKLRGATCPLLVTSAFDVERAVDEKHALDLTQAHLIESMCCLGRETLDFYFLRVRAPLQEFQVSGALEALEDVRQEGHVRHLGLWSDNDDATLAAWQIHDAFDLICLDVGSSLQAMARNRRVGILFRGDGSDVLEGQPFLHSVTRAAEITAIVEAYDAP
jgi:hypothetical protein